MEIEERKKNEGHSCPRNGTGSWGVPCCVPAPLPPSQLTSWGVGEGGGAVLTQGDVVLTMESQVLVGDNWGWASVTVVSQSTPSVGWVPRKERDFYPGHSSVG